MHIRWMIALVAIGLVGCGTDNNDTNSVNHATSSNVSNAATDRQAGAPTPGLYFASAWQEGLDTPSAVCPCVVGG